MQVIRCPHCAKPLADDVSLCPVCSTSAASPAQMSSQPSTHRNNDASTDPAIEVPSLYGTATNSHVHISTPAAVKRVPRSRSITTTLSPKPTVPLPQFGGVSQNVGAVHPGDDEASCPGNDEGPVVGVRGGPEIINSDIMLSGTNWQKVVGTQPSRIPPPVPPRPPSSPRVPTRLSPSLFFWISIILLAALVVGGLFGVVVALGNNVFHQPPPHHDQLSLQITPSNVSLGATISLQGSNFSPDAQVGLTRDMNIPIFDTTNSHIIKTNDQGNFAVTVLVTSDWQAGEHIIRAEDAITHKTASFTITATGKSTSLRPAHLVLSSTTINLGDGDITTNSTQAIMLNNAGGGAISWQTTVTQPWLLVSPNSGTFSTSQSANVVIAGDRSNLKPNALYTADIIFMSDAGKVSIPVTMRVSPLRPEHEAMLQLAPAVLSFTAVDAAASPAAQVITVSNPGVRPLEWQASSDSSWLSVSPQSNILTTGNSQRVSITVNTSTLLPGTYSGRVTFTGQQSEAVQNSPQSIFVSLTVVPQCTLQALPGGLTFSSVFLQDAPAPKVISLSGSPGCSTPLSWKATTTTNNGVHWLTISTTNGSTPSYPVISVNTNHLTPGNYTGAIIFSSSAGSHTVPVTYTMQQPTTPVLSTSPAVTTFAGIVGQPAPTSQVVNITNTGGETLQWTATAETTVGGAWLAVSPASGNLAPNRTAAVTITSTPLASLVPGTYNGTITITGTDDAEHAAPGSPQTIPVTFIVQAPCTVAVAPTDLTFAGTVGQAAPLAPQTAKITTPGACTHPLKWATTVATNPAGGTWLTATPATGKVSIGAPSATNIAVSLKGVAAGTYTGTVTVTATDRVTKQAVGTPQTVTVTFTVQPQCTLQPPSVATLPFTTQKGSDPAPKTFTIGVTENCKGSITITPTVRMTSGTGWLTVTPASATITSSETSTFTVTVTSASLAAGSYTGSISLATGPPAGSSQTVAVTVSVIAAPTLTVSPTSLKFNSTTGTTSQPITIGNSGGEPLNWTAALASDAPDFVSLSSGSGTNLAGGTNTAVDVIVDATGVESGTYTTNVTIDATDPTTGEAVAGSPVTVTITIRITAPTPTSTPGPTPTPNPTPGPTPTPNPTPNPTPAVLAPSLQLSASNLTFTAKAGGKRPASQAITVTNSGGGTLTWTVGTPSQAWLRVTPTSGSDAAGMSNTLTFSVRIKGLVAGTYTAIVDITPSAGPAVTVTVTLTVR